MKTLTMLKFACQGQTELIQGEHHLLHKDKGSLLSEARQLQQTRVNTGPLKRPHLQILSPLKPDHSFS